MLFNKTNFMLRFCLERKNKRKKRSRHNKRFKDGIFLNPSTLYLITKALSFYPVIQDDCTAPKKPIYQYQCEVIYC